ncbi:MAG: HEAT repeat domain-containing protein [Firmicutes bacterium]|nr:HEAT repeat domain-containing protein [Bacillota bacterium]
MAHPSSSGADGEKQSQKVHPFWGALVIMAALAVIFVMAYPFIASRQSENLPLPTAEETAVKVADRMAPLSSAERARLARELLRSPNPLIRLAAVEAIEDWKVREAFPLLETAMEDNYSSLRRRAMESLWRMDREKGMRLLLAGLKDDDVDIRRAAISQLRFANEKRFIPAVIPLLDDRDATVRFFALGVLRKLTGMPYFARISDPPAKRQEVIRQWKQWWAKQQSRWEKEIRWATVSPIHPTRTDPAPALRVTTIDDSRKRLTDYRGKLLLLHFYGTWCAPCEAEMPELVRVREAFPESQLAMLGIAVNETQGERAVREWVKKFNLTYPQALATPAIVSGYWIQGVPVTYLIDAQGRIRYRWDGERDFETFRRAIVRLLQGEPSGRLTNATN